MYREITASVKMTASANDIHNTTAFLEQKTGNDSIIDNSEFEIDNSNCRLLDMNDMTALATEMAKAAPDARFMMNGYIDASGSMMDFELCYENGTLTVKNSLWYYFTDKDSYDSYEDFVERNFDEDYDRLSEEEYDALGNEIFLLDEGNGEITNEVPLTEETIINII